MATKRSQPEPSVKLTVIQAKKEELLAQQRQLNADYAAVGGALQVLEQLENEVGA